MKLFAGLFVAFVMVSLMEANAQTKERLVVLPFSTGGVDSVSARTLTSLLRNEIESLNKYEVVETGLTPATECQDISCAADVAKTVKASRVVYGSFSRLGSTIIMEYTLADAGARKRIYSDTKSAPSVENLQYSIGSIARSIVQEKQVSETPQTGNAVTPNRVMNRRYDTVSIGGGVGQMYPQHGYPGASKPFVVDTRMALEYPNYSLNLLASIRYGLLLNFGATFYPVNAAVSPYVGGGLGYHLVLGGLDNSTSGSTSDNVDDSGFDAMLSFGIMFMRRSTIRFYVNGDYMYTFNNFDDKALVVTLGIVGITDAIRF